MLKIIAEGGNIFKSKAGEELTRRIDRDDVKPTVYWLQTMLGIPLLDNMLGTTGKAPTSGDLDLAVDDKVYTKDDLVVKLTKWCTANNLDPKEYIRKTGVSVHFKTPINNDPSQGFVQTDFMLGNPEWMKFSMQGGQIGSPFKGIHKHILLASVAKAKGMKWSFSNGLINRETNEVISREPDKIAQIVLGPGANRTDLSSVESILAKIKDAPNYAALIADAKETLGKEGIVLPESRNQVAWFSRASSLVESLTKDVKVIYPGRFQPFHKGHAMVFKHLCDTYGADNVYICTSGKVELPKSPFSFAEKKMMMMLTGIPEDRIVESTQPYRAMEIVSKFDANNTVLIFAVSEKDMAEDPRFTFGTKKDGSPTYLQPLKSVASAQPLSKHGYLTTVPTYDFTVLGKPANSASQIRAMFAQADDATQKKIVQDLFGKQSPSALRMMKSKLTESVLLTLTEGARIQHAEDLILWEGAAGALRAIKTLAEVGSQKDVTLKWDGSPALYFGRLPDGRFVLTDKSGFTAKGYNGLVTSADQLFNMFMNRGKEVNDARKQFASKMAALWPRFEKVVPKDFRGFVKGDLLYAQTPQRDANGDYTFTPNTVTYHINADSPLGKKVGMSTTAIAVHSYTAGPNEDDEPVDVRDLNATAEVVVFGPTFVEHAPKINMSKFKAAASFVQKHQSAIDTMFAPATLAELKLSDLSDVFYTYVNGMVKAGTLSQLASNFVGWLSTSKVSAVKQERIIAYIKQHPTGFAATFQVVEMIMHLKDDIIDQLDSADTDIRATINGEVGGEGYVRQDLKLVNRAKFSKANFLKDRT